MKINKIGIIGAGQMGSGIGQLFAMKGFEVLIHDSLESALETVLQNMGESLDKLEKKGRLGDLKRDTIIKNIKVSTEIKKLHDANFIVEAVTENEEIKSAIFTRLDSICMPEAVLATNTSSISITKLGACTKRPQQVIGMHFMNPPIIMKLVEIIKGLNTSEETVNQTREIASVLGKEVVVCEEAPGFIVNRILIPMINEAIFILQEKLSTPEEIDKAMVLGTRQPMGPLALADFIGLDTCLGIMDILYSNIGDPKYRACPLLRKYVGAGLLGRKTNKGFYEYKGSEIR